MSVADLVCLAMLLSASSSAVREMVAFNSRGDVKCKSLYHQMLSLRSIVSCLIFNVRNRSHIARYSSCSSSCCSCMFRVHQLLPQLDHLCRVAPFTKPIVRCSI